MVTGFHQALYPAPKGLILAAKFSNAAHGTWLPTDSEQRDILATIAETTGAFIQVADLNYRWLAINKASADEFERIFGVRPKVGLSMLDILADRPEHQAAVKAVWSRALDGEEFTEIGEFGDHERRFYEMKYNNFYDAEGNRIGAFQIVTDATERMRAQQALEKAEAALRQSQKMEAIGQLTGGMAHDFNNLLQIIAGNLDLLQRNLPKGQARLRRYIDNALRGSARATELAHRLLAFAKPTPGVQRVVDANQLLQSMSDLIRHAVGERIAVSFELLDRAAPIKVDPNQLESAVLNLVVNARDAMPAGGRLVISTAEGTAQDLPLNRRNEPGLVANVVCVADSGEGMDEHTLGHLFEPFFTTKRPGHGTGLGLAMVYSFVHMAGGHIQVRSAPGEGSLFRLGFPRAEAEELPVDAVTESTILRSRSQQLILVVEDDDDVRQHSVETLRDLGYRVIEAHDGQSALSLLAKHKGDIALMFCDIGLPDGASGRELATEARQRHPGLRVLYTSGSADADAVGEDGSSPEPMIAKPFSFDNLALRMREMLDKPGNGAE